MSFAGQSIAITGASSGLGLELAREFAAQGARVALMARDEERLKKAAAECGLKRLIHTGPFHAGMNHNADYWHDHEVVDDVPLHPGDDLYAMSKYLGNQVTRVFAEREGLEVLTYLFCGFRPREILPEQRGTGVGSFTVSWEDTGESMLCGLRAPAMENPYEVFFIAAGTPDRKHRVDKARRLLGWQARDTWEAMYRRS